MVLAPLSLHPSTFSVNAVLLVYMFIALLLVPHNEDDDLGVVDTHRTSSTGSEKTIFTRQFWELDCIENLGGSNTVIAILDSGLQESHLAFNETIWKEKSRQFCTCKESCDCKPYNEDIDGHGTCSAAIAAGRCFESFPGGVANKAKLIICKVCDKTNFIHPRAVIKALQYIIDLQKTDESRTNSDKDKQKSDCRVHVVSMSFGFKRLKPKTCREMQQKINILADQGTICVAAAGNENTVLYPAKLQYTLSVGSHDRYKKPSHFSSKCSKIFCLAPGERVSAPTIQNNEKLSSNNGTSLAAPAVAGLVALIIQRLHEMERCDLVYFNFIRTCLEDMTDEEVLNPRKFFSALCPKYLEYLCNR